MSTDLTGLSKFLSLILRHAPHTIGLALDAEGWVEVDALLRQGAAHGHQLDRELLETLVATSDKQRFVISDDGLRVRANQGHSLKVDLQLDAQRPPQYLFHGTATRFLASIRALGLHPRSRRSVHLCTDEATARTVGQRHGRATILVIEAGLMHAEGRAFFLSRNGVWLTAEVPPQFIRLPAQPV